MKVDIPQGEYIKKIEVNDLDIDVEFSKKKKVALVFICLNNHYWPYLTQVIKDCRKNFLPQHNVDYFAWTDINEDSKNKLLSSFEDKLHAWQKATPESKQDHANAILSTFATLIRLYEVFYPTQINEAVQELQQQGMIFKREGAKYWIESARPMNDLDVMLFYEIAKRVLLLSFSDLDQTLKNVTVIDTEPVAWPAPTLMRYHLFLNEEEKLKEYDYIFYMDADMKVVSKVSDEILGEGLTAAEHPMYSLRKQYIPPYEPNKDSTAYIPRPGAVVTDETGQARFKPYYYAGGFQGGPANLFLEAMKVMKANIDKDFTKNYIPIWNDESMWNRYLFDTPPSIVLSPAYIYPDSLIKEYYEPLWGRSYEPKIITLTKPFSLSAEGGSEINKFIKK